MAISRLTANTGSGFLASALFLLLALMAYAGSITAAPAAISGDVFGTVTEDVDPDGDTLLEVGGLLTVADPDSGESFFKPQVSPGRYGHLYINAWGNWSYAVRNDLPAVQSLTGVQYLQETISISSLDGTRGQVYILILGADEHANTPAVIGGVARGNVKKDVDPNGNNLLEIGGKLTINDPDAGESYFKPQVATGSYGALYINSFGEWAYAVANDLAAVQGLSAADSLTDILTVSSLDGTTKNVVITIRGAGQNGDINIRWTAPAAREDGTAISMAEISGYRVYYGAARGSYTNTLEINSSSTMSATLSNLASGTYYIVITTVDTAGRESAYSQEVIRNL